MLILLAYLYGYGTSCFTLKEGHRFVVLENKMMKKIFYPRERGSRGIEKLSGRLNNGELERGSRGIEKLSGRLNNGELNGQEE